MLGLQQALEREFLGVDPLPMSLKRGRKAGSKVKKLKDGSRVVVTGRAATAIQKRQETRKTRPAKAKKAAPAPSRGPGRPRKGPAAAAPKAEARRPAHRRKAAKPRSGIIA